MTMREQLVKRVADLCLQADKEGLNTGPLEDYRKHFHGLMADECLRQMEWAHWGYAAAITTAATPETSFPLTLAPEDWKP